MGGVPVANEVRAHRRSHGGYQNPRRLSSILSQETLREAGAGRCAGCFDDPAPRSESLIQYHCTGIHFGPHSRLGERDNVPPVHDTTKQDSRNVVLESIDTLKSHSRDHQSCPNEENLFSSGLFDGIDLVEEQNPGDVGTTNTFQNGIDDVNTLVQVPHSSIDDMQQ
jgi:hypothetical protein